MKTQKWIRYTFADGHYICSLGKLSACHKAQYIREHGKVVKMTEVR